MFLWTLIEVCLVFLVGFFVVTQLIIPALTNRPTFPLFRKVEKTKDEVEEELREEKVCLETEMLRIEVENLKKEKEGLIKQAKEREQKQ